MRVCKLSNIKHHYVQSNLEDDKESDLAIFVIAITISIMAQDVLRLVLWSKARTAKDLKRCSYLKKELIEK
jgi:hypothetical protein